MKKVSHNEAVNKRLVQVRALIERVPSKKEKDVKQFKDQGLYYPQMRREEMDRPPEWDQGTPPIGDV